MTTQRGLPPDRIGPERAAIGPRGPLGLVWPTMVTRHGPSWVHGNPHGTQRGLCAVAGPRALHAPSAYTATDDVAAVLAVAVLDGVTSGVT
jgi:hypothetical protein